MRFIELGLDKAKMSKTKRKIVVENKVEATEVVKILQHRTFKNGKTKLKILWNNNDSEWHDNVEAVREDFPEVVDNYFNNNKVKDVAPKSNVVYTDDENFVCNMNHEDYSVGITYKEEPNHLYWIDGGSLGGVFCNGCNGNFTSAKCKPNNVKPAYTCTNRLRGCEICYCNACFNKKMEKFLKVSDGVRQRRSRSNPN